jgi:tetratricopeptide (TPR) repeat protein
VNRSKGGILKKLLPLVLLTASLYGQHDHTAPSTPSPVPLYTGLGTWRHPIATRSELAQKYFDQGLVLMYGFNRREAFRSFQRAAELDPGAGMAYWGMSSALGPYVNMDLDSDYQIKESCAAAGNGLALADLSKTDRAWLEAAQTRCPDFADPNPYIKAMRNLALAHPDDPDAQTLYAEALMIRTRWRWYEHRQPVKGVAEAEQILEAVLRRFPYHPGANHLYIHAVESSPTPERGIPSAQRLMGIVPAAGHMVHMPGHIWLAIGDFDNAVTVNEHAAQVDREYFAKAGTDSAYYMYYLHNLSFIVYCRAMQGRVSETSAAIQQMNEAATPLLRAMPEMAGVFQFLAAGAELRNQQWDAILAAAHPDMKSHMDLSLWHLSRALAYAWKGQRELATREQAQFEAERKLTDRNLPWGSNKLGDVMDLAAVVLEARVCMSPAEAIEKLRQAVSMQDALAYDEPPDWFYPVRESLGARLLRNGDAVEAESVFREGLARSPNNGRMLFGLVESLKAQRKAEAAAWVEREFAVAWKAADLKLKIEDL